MVKVVPPLTNAMVAVVLVLCVANATVTVAIDPLNVKLPLRLAPLICPLVTPEIVYASVLASATSAT